MFLGALFCYNHPVGDSLKKALKINKKIEKIKRLIAGLLIMVVLGNQTGQFPFDVPDVYADDDSPNDQLGIIAILVEEELMSDFAMRARIMTYAENAQSRVPHSKAFVMEVAEDESTYRISNILEQLYFEGIDTELIDGNPLNDDAVTTDDNQLIGVIAIGEVPLPVVHEGDGNFLPSLYPYTDFYRKAYIYDHETQQFEKNSGVNEPNPEVWHGVIRAPSQDPVEAEEELTAFFEKNNDYSNGQNGYDTFEQRLLYANFSDMEAQMNAMDYDSYQRYLDYMEEMTFRRYNKHLLVEFLDRVKQDMGSDDPLVDESTIENMFDIHTEIYFDQYTLDFADALKIYRGGLNEVAEQTGRWDAGQVDSLESLITLRDEYARHEIHRSQLELEQAVDEFVTTAIPPPERAVEVVTKGALKVSVDITEIPINTEFFDFYSYIDGVEINTVQSTSQCGIQVGTEHNDNVSTLEDNSVVVNANQFNAFRSLLTPEEGEDNWKLEEQSEYIGAAGCVYNNRFEDEDQGTSPDKCNVNEATQSLFDINGSLELEPDEVVYSDANRCSFERMDFLLQDETQFDNGAAVGQLGQIQIGQDLDTVIETAYLELNGNLQAPSPNFSPSGPTESWAPL